jgi:hypothetical protein
VPLIFRGTLSAEQSTKLLDLESFWWAHKGSNLGPLPCEDCAFRPANSPIRKDRAEGRPSTARQQQIRFVPAPFMLRFALLPPFSFWFHARIGVSDYLDMVGVTGSIPVVPTSLLSLRELRLGKPETSIVAERAKAVAPKPEGHR